MSESEEHTLEDVSDTVPTLMVPEQTRNSDSNQSSPRSVSPARSETPPLDSEVPTSSRSDSAIHRVRRPGSKGRPSHSRRGSKTKDDVSEDSAPPSPVSSDAPPTSLFKPTPRDTASKIAGAKSVASSSTAPVNEKGAKDAKRLAPVRSTSSSPGVAPVAPKGTFFNQYPMASLRFVQPGAGYWVSSKSWFRQTPFVPRLPPSMPYSRDVKSK